VLFGVAVCALFVFKPLRLGLSPSAALLLPCLPPLVPLAAGGSSGFAMIALLAGFGVLLAGFRLEKNPPSFFKRILLPFLFLACYAVLVLFSGFPLFLSVSVFCLFCGVLIFSLRFTPVGEKVFPGRQDRGTGHRRFSPVQILSRKEHGLSFAWIMLPFAVPALVLAFTGFETASSSSSGFPFPPPGLISEADWQDHFYFQSNFSHTSLYETDARMPEYVFSQDGLLTPDPQPPVPVPHITVPPFPLGGFLSDFDTATLHQSSSRNGFAVYEFLCALVPLAFIIPAMVHRRKKKNRHGWSWRGG
jgi:Ca2+/Na+ antiporter